MDALADLIQTYTGTQSAIDAAPLLASYGNKSDSRDRLRAQQARALLAMARDEFQSQKLIDCLVHCEEVTSTYSELPEAKEAAALAADARSNPERLANANEELNKRTAVMYLTLADSWTKSGQMKEAVACLEKVVQLAPDSRHAVEARGKLSKLEGRGAAVPTGFKKP